MLSVRSFSLLWLAPSHREVGGQAQLQVEMEYDAQRHYRRKDSAGKTLPPATNSVPMQNSTAVQLRTFS